MEPQNKRILVVDDEPELLKALKEVFQIFGFLVTTATSGNKAWNLLKDSDFDLVISDIRMKDGSGIELLQKCKNRDPLNPRFLVMSGFTDFSEAELYELGVDGFFAKPFDANAIRTAIKDSLLSLHILWGTDHSPKAIHHYYNKWETLDAAINSGKIQFGRRGFFVPIKKKFPEKGQIVSFDFENKLASPSPKITGYGKVLWVREKSSKDADSGVGIMIQHIADNSLSSFIQWLEVKKYKSLVPFGRKIKK
ncbi:MAG: response regulator [Bdellovibrionaceae bacterium]|nr:response regulator [Pseudobdellovibrionaceae bacterium]